MTQPTLTPLRVTRCLPEHLPDLKHEIHTLYGRTVKIENEGNWKKVTWDEGFDPNQPRQVPLRQALLAGVEDES